MQKGRDNLQFRRKDKKKRVLHKKKRDAQALLLAATCSSASAIFMPLPGLFTLLVASTIFVPESIAFPSAFVLAIFVLLSKSAPPSTFASIMSMPVPELSAFPSMSRLSAPLSPSPML